MKNLYLPAGYQSALSLLETQEATAVTRDLFQQKLGTALQLTRITCPLFVTKGSGINDDLNGVERKVEFTMLNVEGTAEIVQSLAKWKRMALYRYQYPVGTGIYTNMSAIRRDDDCDSLHSIYVDQWDWEKVITKEDRTEAYLKDTVCKIVNALVDTKEELNRRYPQLKTSLQRDVTFVTTQELEDQYPELSSKERENAFVKEHKTVFIMQIGGKLRSGQKHDGRAPDYDDWSLNGDIFFWNETLGCAEEISSMGIRVDADSLKKQLAEAGAEDRMAYPFHQGIVNGTIPLTIGGGIGQSRVCLLLLEKAHIGEVQVSLWPEEMVTLCRENNIFLLQ